MKGKKRCQCGCPPSQHFEFIHDGTGCLNCRKCDHYVEETHEPTLEEMFGGPR